MKEKIILIGFGLILGLVITEVALEFLIKPKEGSEFESIDDLRKAMLDNRGADKLGGKKGATMKEVVNPHPNDKIIYDLKPNIHVKFAGSDVQTNSCGMRSPERPLVKSPATYRIALLGDSFAFGWALEEKESFAHVLEDTLNRQSGGKIKFEVLNFGVPGYSTFQEVEVFKEKGIEFNPDAVIVFFIRNDFDFPFWVRDVSAPGGLMSGFQLAQIASKADPKIGEEKMRLKGLDPNTSLTELADLTKAKGIKLFLLINPRKDWMRDRKRLTVLDSRDDIQLMDVAPSYEETVKLHGYTEEQLTLPKDPHPTALRARIYGELMATYFMDVM